MIEILVKKLRDHLYRFEECGGPNQVHAYLICGSEKALMVDGLWLAEGLLAETEKILKLEYGESDTQENRNNRLKMLITHGHEDHAGKGMEEFLRAGCSVYLSEKDWSLLAEKYRDQKDQITYLTEEKNIEVGGITAQVRKMPGHTPGSLMVYVPEWHILCTSDAVGAGVLWMQLPECSPLVSYEQELYRFLAFLEEEKKKTGEEVIIYPGHAQQIRSESGEEKDSLNYAYVGEVLCLTQKILKNPQIGEPKTIDYQGLEGVKVRSAAGKLLYDYCYDEERCFD